MLILPFVLDGQELKKGKNFPKVVEKSNDFLKIKVSEIPIGYVATAYFRLSWEDYENTYGVPMNGGECIIDEYCTTIPENPSEYVDYILRVSIAGVNADGSRFTTNAIDLIIDKTSYSNETENAPDIPQSQYDGFVENVSQNAIEAKQARDEAVDARNDAIKAAEDAVSAASSSMVFTAISEVTTYDKILEAYKKGMLVVCKHYSYTGYLFFLNEGANYAVFYTHEREDTILRMICSAVEGWKNVQFSHVSQEYVDNAIGDIENALDNIIAEQEAIIEIQNNLIGGGVL